MATHFLCHEILQSSASLDRTKDEKMWHVKLCAMLEGQKSRMKEQRSGHWESNGQGRNLRVNEHDSP